MIFKKNKLALFLIFTLFLVSVYFLFTTSSYVRFWADDFCSSVLLRTNGYWNSQIIWWKSWTGRYSYIAFLDLFELFGTNGARVLPIILAALFTLPLVLLFGVVGLLILPIILVNSPNIIQSFYWMTGSLNYFAPFVLLNFYLLIIFKPLKKYNSILIFLLLFIATGFSEAFGIANMLFLLFLYLITTNTNRRKFIITGIIATISSLVLMSLSPGNDARSATVSHPANLFELIKSTLIYSKWYLVHLFYIKSFVISIFVIITSVFAYFGLKVKYFKNPKLVILLTIVFMVGITLAVVGLTHQAMNWEPPERVMSIVNNFILVLFTIFSVALSQMIGKRIPKSVLNLLFVISMAALIYQASCDWGKVKSEVSDYSSKWDQVEVLLLNSKNQLEVLVPNVKSVGKLDGFVENKGWVLSCIKAYYRTGNIIVE
ncbi:hypothetical protein KBD45_06165 [Candidatus Dojkabacteria bacterium]|nr:hypothetical protein [Candidatus Dojkabacteria bacterium]